MPTNPNIQALLIKSLFKKPLTAEESKALDAWYQKRKDLPEGTTQIVDASWVAKELHEMEGYPSSRIWAKIQTGLSSGSGNTKPKN